jgi:hypothetical protein
MSGFRSPPLRSRFHKSLRIEFSLTPGSTAILESSKYKNNNNKEESSGNAVARFLAYITGRVDKELPVHNEYLAAENRILRAEIKGEESDTS